MIEFILVDTSVAKPLVVEESGIVGDKADNVQSLGLI